MRISGRIVCVVRTAHGGGGGGGGTESHGQLEILEDCLIALPLLSRTMQEDAVMMRQLMLLLARDVLVQPVLCEHEPLPNQLAWQTPELVRPEKSST